MHPKVNKQNNKRNSRYPLETATQVATVIQKLSTATLTIARSFCTALPKDSLISQLLLNHRIQQLKENPSKVTHKPLPQHAK